METEQNNLDSLKGKNPFIVPEGYMEGLTAQIMNQLPEKKEEEPKSISLMDRMRPWLYMAAVFAGLGLFFRVLLVGDIPEEGTSDSLIVKTNVTAEPYVVIQTIEDEEYLEYLEAQYTDYLLADEMAGGE